MKSMQLQINNICNQKCKHCYLEQTPEFMSFEQFNEVLDKFVTKNDGEFIILIGGEPCLHPDLIKMIQTIPNEIGISLATNGTLLSDELLTEGRKRKNFRIQISVDGTKEVHDMIRGRGNYEKVIAGIKKAIRFGIPVHVSFTVNNLNYKTITELYEEMHKIGVDFVWADRMVPFQNNFLKAVSEEEYKKFIQDYYEANKKYGRNHHLWRALQFFANPNEVPIYSCGIGRHWNVKANGEVVLCARLNIKTGLNIFENTAKEINDSIKRIANYVPQECVGCEFEKKCMGGAKCMTWWKYRNLDKKDPACPFS